MTSKLTGCGRTLVTLWAAFALSGVGASEGFVSPEDFLARSFPAALPPSQVVWISGELKSAVTEILGHKPNSLRVRYWGDAGRSAWIVDEIGKTEPITIGIIVREGQIEATEVLAFRESRGWEIKHDFFTRQFIGAGLGDGHRMDRTIDGISGATLSVQAMTKVARMVLYLAQSIST